MEFEVSPRHPFKVPVSADCISPDIFAVKSIEDIVSLKIWEGNKNQELKDLFRIEAKSSNPDSEVVIHIKGDVGKVRMIGSKMTSGKISVEGNVGNHLGHMMSGGEITVHGNAASWMGEMMKGGTIEVEGSAGDYVGAPSRGNAEGMKGGAITIHGNAGSETGSFMRGGVIRVHGDVGQFAGHNMKDGIIFVQGNSEGRVGAAMIGGKIIISGHIPSVLPTFQIDSIRNTSDINGEKILGPFYRFTGDIAESGNGKLFIAKTKNPQLIFYEKYL